VFVSDWFLAIQEEGRKERVSDYQSSKGGLPFDCFGSFCELVEGRASICCLSSRRGKKGLGC
jgi:hypothetical protein